MSDLIDGKPVAIIAEDEDIGRLLLAETAHSSGLSALTFDNGIEALDAALSYDAAIILLDVDMPGLNGYAVCRRIREDRRLGLVPIVMVTGHEDTDAINQAFEAGATDYISKPVNWALLPHRLAYILRNASVARDLADRERKVNALVDAIPDALWVVSPSGALRWSPNDSGASATPVPSEHVWHLNVPVSRERVNEMLYAIELTAGDGIARHLEFRDDHPDARLRSVELRFSRCEDGDVLVVRQDTSERTAAAEHIERLAYFDAQTGLPNRQRCMAIAAGLITKDAEQGIGFIHLELSGFKRIIETFGHSFGEVALNGVSKKLQLLLVKLRQADQHLSLSRLGPQDFLILARGADLPPLAAAVAQACHAELKEPIVCKSLEFFVAPSVGVSLYPKDGRDPETLLKHAETALHQARTAAVSEVVMYSASMSARLRDHVELESKLRKAVRESRLSLHYQPKFRLRDNRVLGAEALIRWFDPEYGEISPSQFIPIAEQTGLMLDIGKWLADTICGQVRAWANEGIRVPIAINVSGKELEYGNPAAVIQDALIVHGIPAELIEIEITESVFVSDSNAARRNVLSLRDLGCKIALDDFGTGYSSLGYLTRFPPDRLKIDRSFVQNVDKSVSESAIVSAIMSLANALQLSVTAEGIERSTQLEWLRAHGCQEGQGYLLSRPLSAEACRKVFLDQIEPDVGQGAQDEFRSAPNLG